MSEGPADLIPARFLEHALSRPDDPAYHVREAGGWRATSWGEYAGEARRAGRALVALGLEPRQSACILGFNRPEWVVFDLACMMAGGAPAGIYTTCSPQQVRYIVGHAEASVVLVENQEQWSKVRSVRDDLPRLRHVVTMRGAGPIDDPMTIDWEAFLRLARDVPEELLDRRLAAVAPEDPATLIYTSGTTGPPKAVMLSHASCAWAARVAGQLVGLGPGDRGLSYLPLAHVAEQVMSIYCPSTSGNAVYFASSIAEVPENLQEVQPTVFFGVPRIWEKFHALIAARLGGLHGLKRRLVGWARRIGSRVSSLRNGGRQPGPWLRVRHALARRLVFAPLRSALGLGGARLCVSGAAPIGREVLEFLASLDLVVHEVYGQSENCGLTSLNVPGRTRFGTVGQVIPGLEVEIASDGEILVRGPDVFLGYYKDDALSAQTLSGGWLHTGDLGAFDAEGFLSITGRKKEIIITAGGKNIAPRNLEEALKGHELIAEAVLIGDRRPFLSALVAIDEEAGRRFAAGRGIDPAGLREHPALVAEVQKGIDAVNSTVSRVEQVRAFRLLPRSLTIEDGELTPTLKVRRNVVAEHFAAEIASMYGEERAVGS